MKLSGARTALLTVVASALLLTACSEQNDFAPQLTAGERSDESSTMRPETDAAVLAGLADYTDWQLVNPVRFRQRERITELCIFRPEDWQRCNRESEHVFSSHAGIHVFVNPLAEAPMLTQSQPRFPEGSIIVKQKWHAAEQATPELLTVMIKREDGYNPDVGDWEFLALSGDAARIDARGRLGSCQECHIPRADTDFVIRSYLPEDILAQLE